MALSISRMFMQTQIQQAIKWLLKFLEQIQLKMP